MCLNPNNPQTCPKAQPTVPAAVSAPLPKPALASAPAPSLAKAAPSPDSNPAKMSFSNSKGSPSNSAGVIAAATVVAVASVLAGLLIFAFVVRRRKRRASASGTAAAAEHGHPRDIHSMNAGPAAGMVGGTPKPAPSTMAPAAVFTGNAPPTPQEAAAPAAVVHGTAVREAGNQGAGNQDKVPLEVESAMLSLPPGLQPTATSDLERSNTWNYAKGSGVVEQQALRESLNSSMNLRCMLNAGVTSSVDSSQVPLSPLLLLTLCISSCNVVALHYLMRWQCVAFAMTSSVQEPHICSHLCHG
jgi:hypothetical protein